MKAQELFDAAFAPEKMRDPRSEEYKRGVLAALRHLCELTRVRNPFTLGTAQADAFFAGIDEGYAIYRRAHNL